MKRIDRIVSILVGNNTITKMEGLVISVGVLALLDGGVDIFYMSDAVNDLTTEEAE